MKILLLIPFFTFGQNFVTKYNAEVHFYSAFAVNEVSYQTLSLACPKWKPAKKILISNGITLLAVFGKEIYDVRKANPTGFSWPDAFVGTWSIPVYDIFRVCVNDFKKRREYSFENKRLIVY
jgi:hypothetical protein